MLGYLVTDGRGAADALMREVAKRLQSRGLSVAGAVQVNHETDPEKKCHMDLHVLTGRTVIRISQDLGALSKGCRLDPDGLERAVGLVAAALETDPDLLIVNKFGKQEIDGRGFRPVVGEALTRGIPVLLAVNPGSLDAFEGFAAGLAHRLPDNVEQVVSWCLSQSMPDDDGESVSGIA
ncbi:DUF2478 domain-containing protein [Tropicimonas marinistellae]|uniref:DUF2478 domain-containing protein n=1 Tax=Tropicimonas marinistellae TaxID=1739787 RepID=UPI0008364D73|nr:DUF2478 domain-containing protein [Tropicimonas marinistellae]